MRVGGLGPNNSVPVSTYAPILVEGNNNYGALVTAALDDSNNVTPLRSFNNHLVTEGSLQVGSCRYSPIASLEMSTTQNAVPLPMPVRQYNGAVQLCGTGADLCVPVGGSASLAFLQGSEGGEANARARVANSLPWFFENLSSPAVWGEGIRNSGFRLMVASTAGTPSESDETKSDSFEVVPSPQACSPPK